MTPTSLMTSCAEEQVSVAPDRAESFDIVICGGGIVGAAMAAALTHTRYRVALIEAQPLAAIETCVWPHGRVHEFDARVSALTTASEILLRRLGVWDDIQARGICAYQGMQVWDGEGTGGIAFSASELGQPALGHIVENSVIVQALYRYLVASNKVTLFMGAGIGGVAPAHVDGVSRLSLADGRCLVSELLIAADGANSLLRQRFAIPTREWDYNHHAIVATVQTALCHEHTAWQRFMPTGPLAFLPLHDVAGQGNFCSIVWSLVPERAAAMMALSDEAFCQALAEAFEYRLGPVQAVSSRHAIPLRQRHAKTYVKAGVVLVGDAAHTIHPLAGQGVNLGLMDVAVLVDELQQANRRGVPASDTLLLQRYQRRRMAANLGMMGAMEAFKRLFAADNLGLRLLRNTGMRWLNDQSLLKNRVVSHAMGLDAFVPEFRPVSGSSS